MAKKIFVLLICAVFILCSGCGARSGTSMQKSNGKSADISAWITDWDFERGVKEVQSVSVPFNSIQMFAVYFDKNGRLFVPQNVKKLLKESPKELEEQKLCNLSITVVNDTVSDKGESIQEKDQKIVQKIVTDEKVQKENIDELALIVKNSPFEGLVLDYEKIPYENWNGYAAYIGKLGSMLEKEGKTLKIVLEPESPIDSVKLPKQYEYTMMAYNLYGPKTSHGPKADKKFIENLCDKMNKNFDKKRIAFSLGGFDWPQSGNVTAVTESQAEKLLSKSGSSKKRYKESEAVYFSYKDSKGENHTVCYADKETLLYWIGIARKKRITSFELWRLGGNDISTLSDINKYVTSKISSDDSNDTAAEANGKSNVISGVVTGEKILSLTFNGLPDEKKTKEILDELDELNIKATFFISGIKAGEESESARMIVQRGHELGDSTLTGIDLTKISYNEKVKQIGKSRDAIIKFSGAEPKYLRPGHAAVNDEVCTASYACGYDDIITYNVNPNDYDGKSPQETAQFVSSKKKKGGIVILDADKNQHIVETISLIYKSLKAKGYSFVPLSQLVEIYKCRKENQFVPRTDIVKVDPDYKNTEYKITEKGTSGKKQVALTFDDWGSDDTVDCLLDILDKYNVKATFFLRANGVERNPSLALAISEKGHEIGNHTYSHIDFDKMTPLQLQEDIVKAHYIIAKAINKEPKIYLRPPRGGVDSKTAKAVAACGYKNIIIYNVDPNDWDRTKTASYISKYVLDNTTDGSIILLHMLDNLNTEKALPSIIEGLETKGYNFVTVSKMLNQ